MTRSLALLAVLSAAAQAQPYVMPPVQIDGAFAFSWTRCDCAEKDYVFQTRAPLDGRAEPAASSPVVRRVESNRLVEGNDWSDVLTVVYEPASGVLQEPLHLDPVRLMPDPRRGDWNASADVPGITVPAGTRITAFSNGPVNNYVGIGGATYLAPIVPAEANVAWEAEPGAIRAETWYRLVPRRGAPAAWVRVQSAGAGANVDTLCDTHAGCVDGYHRIYRPLR